MTCLMESNWIFSITRGRDSQADSLEFNQRKSNEQSSAHRGHETEVVKCPVPEG
jgi:hypothetical protein